VDARRAAAERVWVAAVVAIPVLFDPLELILEQYAADPDPGRDGARRHG
jgi:hypothetical protein